MNHCPTTTIQPPCGGSRDLIDRQDLRRTLRGVLTRKEIQAVLQTALKKDAFDIALIATLRLLLMTSSAEMRACHFLNASWYQFSLAEKQSDGARLEKALCLLKRANAEYARTKKQPSRDHQWLESGILYAQASRTEQKTELLERARDLMLDVLEKTDSETEPEAYLEFATHYAAVVQGLGDKDAHLFFEGVLEWAVELAQTFVGESICDDAEPEQIIRTKGWCKRLGKAYRVFRIPCPEEVQVLLDVAAE